jgi:EF-P beta-lysylation protein EpmB
MITRFNTQLNQTLAEESWKKLLASGIQNLQELAHYLDLNVQQLLPEGAQQSSLESGFSTRIPLPYASRIKKGELNDPLLRQVLPSLFEQQSAAGFVTDPLNEAQFNPINGLLHKYASRVLLVASSACPIHCRYCFRRHFGYSNNNPGKERWVQVFDYLRTDTTINEAILSGGDPLTASDSHLAWMAQQLASIPHMRRLRIHTRFPVVIPQRVTPELIAWLKAFSLQKVMVLHINHPAEIDDHVVQALIDLKAADVTLLNQSVLLKGVNDSAEVLAALSERLFDAGVLPYYLHLTDKVAGTAHFDVHETEALQIFEQLQALVPGFLLPKLVREIPNQPSKTIIAPNVFYDGT